MGIRGSEGDRKHCRACLQRPPRGPTPPQHQNSNKRSSPLPGAGRPLRAEPIPPPDAARGVARTMSRTKIVRIIAAAERVGHDVVDGVRTRTTAQPAHIRHVQDSAPVLTVPAGAGAGHGAPPRILIGSGGHTCTAGTKDAIRHCVLSSAGPWTARRPRLQPTRWAAASWASTSSHTTHTCLPTRWHLTSPRAHHDWSVRYRRPGTRSRASAARTHSTPSGPVALTPRPRPRPGRRPGPGP